MAALLAGAGAMAADDAPSAPPGLRYAGEGRLTWWGFAAYDARLWLAPGASQRSFDTTPLALELRYLRAFSARDIARVSIEQMRRTGPVDEAQAERWSAQLRRVIPDVKAGDRLLGTYRPGRGASFHVNGKPAGDIDDPVFARRFFAIWLGAGTSEPALRSSLFGTTPP